MHNLDRIPDLGLTDDEIEAIALKHIAPGYNRMRAVVPEFAPYQQSEQFRRVKALLADALSKLRAPVADERGDTALPPLPRSVTRHRDVGDLWDATAMHQYAVRYADLCRPWVAMQARAALASAPVAGEAQPVHQIRLPGDSESVWRDATEDAYWTVTEANRRIVYAAPQASAEQLVRYCPGCGSVGPVEGEYLDCCPDGGEARMIPAPLAEKCRDTFKIAVQGLLADRQHRAARAESIRTGHPFDVPAFEELCREHDVLGTAMSALCAVFWRAAELQLASDPGDRKAWEADMLAAGATHLGGDCWEWDVEDFEFRIWQLGVRRQLQKGIDDARTSEAGDA